MVEEETSQPIDDSFNSLADSSINSDASEEQDDSDALQEDETEANAMNADEAEEQDDSAEAQEDKTEDEAEVDAMNADAAEDQDNSAEAQDNEADFMPSTSEVLSKTVYTACYYVSYGVVFSSLVLANAIPMDNAMGAGLRDGANAARDAVQKRAEEWSSQSVDQGAEGQ